MFSLNSLSSVTKIFFIKGFEPTTNYVRDQDASTVPARNRWETGSLKVNFNSCFSDLSDSLNALNLPNSLNSPNFCSIKGKLQWNSGKTLFYFNSFVSNFIMIMRVFGFPGNFIFQLDVAPRTLNNSFKWHHQQPISARWERHTYRSGTVNSKSFVGKVLLRIKRKFELTYAL